ARAKRALIAVAALAFVGFAVWLVPQLVDFRHHSDAQVRARHAQLVARERARLIAEQRPRHGRAVALRPPSGGGSVEQVRARRSLVGRVEASITADARARVARGLLSGAPPSHTSCGPLVRNQIKGDEDDLAKAIGRYSCVAVVRNAVQRGR